jgi:hypothetical protein
LRFSKARPSDYAEESLVGDPPVSFHKFTGLSAGGPEEVYAKWLHVESDEVHDHRKSPDEL